MTEPESLTAEVERDVRRTGKQERQLIEAERRAERRLQRTSQRLDKAKRRLESARARVDQLTDRLTEREQALQAAQAGRSAGPDPAAAPVPDDESAAADPAPSATEDMT